MSAKASLRQEFRARRLALLPQAQAAIEAQAGRHCPALVPPGSSTARQPAGSGSSARGLQGTGSSPTASSSSPASG